MTRQLEIGSGAHSARTCSMDSGVRLLLWDSAAAPGTGSPPEPGELDLKLLALNPTRPWPGSQSNPARCGHILPGAKSKDGEGSVLDGCVREDLSFCCQMT